MWWPMNQLRSVRLMLTALLAWPAIGAQYLELLRTVDDELVTLGG